MNNSHFAKLSAELRNNIYETVFADHTISEPDPPLINTCRQIRSESLLLYYGRSFEIKLRFTKISTFCIRLLCANAEALDKITQLKFVAMVDMMEDDVEMSSTRWEIFARDLVVLWGLGPDRVQWEVRQTESIQPQVFRMSYAVKLEDMLDVTMAFLCHKGLRRNLNYGLQRTERKVEGGGLSPESEGLVRRVKAILHLHH
ncbi:hypothetical protein LTR10_009551 [Elasticomyces elasticus]|nr:hypothetical protein LTR10_009551 [Elasticomyces elasticus]KAK4971354.1 hypothetical protein LTR42_007081 [Elasticomyces elasticus]